MARTPAPPGAPPPHYRPPGAPASRPTQPTLPGRMIGAPAPPPPQSGLGSGAVTVIAAMTLLIGVVIGFFVGRAVEADEETSSGAPPLTSPSTAPTSRPPGDTVPQSPPGDLDAPPSTDLDPTTIGTLDDPIPAGQSYVLGLYEIRVLGVERDAGPTLTAFDPSNPPPPEGRQHVIVEVGITYQEAEGIGNPGSVPFFVSDGSAEWHDYEASCGTVPESIILAGLIEEGEEAVGNACFTVPTDAVGSLLLGTEGFSGPVYFALE